MVAMVHENEIIRSVIPRNECIMMNYHFIKNIEVVFYCGEKSMM